MRECMSLLETLCTVKASIGVGGGAILSVSLQVGAKYGLLGERCGASGADERADT